MLMVLVRWVLNESLPPWVLCTRSQGFGFQCHPSIERVRLCSHVSTTILATLYVGIYTSIWVLKSCKRLPSNISSSTELGSSLRILFGEYICVYMELTCSVFEIQVRPNNKLSEVYVIEESIKFNDLTVKVIDFTPTSCFRIADIKHT